MDKINIKQLHIRANHGVFASEKELGQNFYLDIEAKLHFYQATIEEDLEKSVHYGELASFAVAEFTKLSYDLIETAASNLAIAILNTYELIDEITITVHKPEAPVEYSFKDISVTKTMKRNRVYIALGSNLGDSNAYFDYAIDQLNCYSAVNKIYETNRVTTKAYGLEEQSDFLNSIVQLETYLSPQDLLLLLQSIEFACNRKREVRWGPRTLDLDILFYNNEIIDEDNLIIPHYDLHNRQFILKPLVELCPHRLHPRLNQTMQELLLALGE